MTESNQKGGIPRRTMIQTTAAAGIALSSGLKFGIGTASAQVPKRGGVVKLVTPQGFPGLDPALTSLGNGDNLHSLLWNGLTRYDEQNNVLPDLAESWDAVDAKTLVFHLRHGVKFHNGREMLASDVVASIKRILDPATASPYRGAIGSIQAVESVDNYTVKITLSVADVTMAESLTSIKIQPPENFAASNTSPVGTGPFRFVEYISGDHLRLARFDGHWNPDSGYPDEFIIQIAKDPISAYNAFKAGQFDIIWQMDFSVVDEVAKNPKLAVVQPKVTGTCLMFAVDCAQPPFNNKLARQALMYATDKQNIVDLAYFGVGYMSPTNNNLVPNHWAFDKDLAPREYNIEKAKELFKQAGIEQGHTFKFNGIAGRADIQTQAEILQQSLKQCGLNLDIVMTDIPGWSALMNNPWANTISFVGQIRGWDPALQLAGLTCNEQQARIHYCNPQVDALMQQGRATLGVEERKKIYNKVQEILYDEVPWVVYIHYTPDNAIWTHVHGIYADGRGMLHMDGVWTDA